MRKYVQRSILKGETRPSYKTVAPTLVCSTPIKVVANGAIIPTFDFNNAPPAFTLILEEDSFGTIASHSIIINNSSVGHIKFKIESITKLNNGQPKPIFSVDTISAFITISAPNASFLRVLPFDGADYEESAHVHLGLIPDPDPRGTSYVSDFNLRSATSLDNKTSVLTSYIAPYEDRTSESVNRAIDSIANNTENVYLKVDDGSYRIVQIKINADIGNDELIDYIQDSNFVNDAIVPIMRKPQNAAWVRSIKQEVIEQEFGSFPEGDSKLEIVAYATNKPIYIANRFENRTDIQRMSSFSEMYTASRNKVVDIIQNDPSGHAGFSQCSNTAKVSTNKDILLGNESSYEAYIKSGRVDDVFGNDNKISNPGTFWIASADVSQQDLDNVFIELVKIAEAEPSVSIDKEFTQQKKFGWVSFPGTLYGTKAMSGSFQCLDRGTIRYVNNNEEKLPIYISEGMLVTNGLDAYEIEQVVDQKTLLLKPVNNYEDILLGDVSLLQRVELIPNLIQNFDIYFGKSLSKTQIAVFATRPISVESILHSQRENDNIAPRRRVSDQVLDLGLLVRMKDTKLGTSNNENLDDDFINEETLGNIDKRLALFNKFIRSSIGANLTADNNASPISLESLADNASSTRSAFKNSGQYISQPTAPNIPDEGYITVPQVLALNLLRKNSTKQSFISATQITYQFKLFEARLTIGVKQFCDFCFLGFSNGVGQFDVGVWRSLIKEIETQDLTSVLQSMISSKLVNFLPIDIEDLSTDKNAFRDFVSLVYSSLKYYGYTSILSVIPKNQFDITAPTDKIQALLFNTVKQQYIDAMNIHGNAVYIGANIFQLRLKNANLAEFFSIEDVGKPFTLSYLYISSQNNVIPYVKQIRVFLEEWYNGSCVRLSFDGMHHNEIEGILSNPCFIGYAPGDIDEIADITEVLLRGSTKAEILDHFSKDITLSKIFDSSFRASNTYFMETSFSNIIVSDDYTYIVLPGINAFKDDCAALSQLPQFIGCYLNLDLATMTYDLQRTDNLIPANVTTSQDFLNNLIRPFFETEIIGQGNGDVYKITPKQNIGVNSVFLDIKMANPRGQTINRLVECTKTCIAYDGTIILRVQTAELLTSSDRDIFLNRFPVNQFIAQLINTPEQFNGFNTNRLEINYVGAPGNIAQWYIDTMPIRRNLLAASNIYAVPAWFSQRFINVINHKQQASVNVLNISNLQTGSSNSKVILVNQYIQKKALDSTIFFDIRPNQSSFRVNASNNKHAEIQSFNDSTAISILQKTSIAQGKNRTEFQEQQGQDNDINSGLQVKTEPRSFNEQSLEKAVNHPTLRFNEQSTVFLYKTRQAGVHGVSLVNTHSVTPAVLGVITNEDGAPTNEDADNFSIGAVTAINKLDNQVFAQSTRRPKSASLQTNQNVIMDDNIIYEGSDNVISGNARTNWKGTGFKRLGGRATSLNTITSARQPDLHEASYSSLVSPHYKRSAKKFFRYVDSRKASQSIKGRGFSSGSINLIADRSQNFRDVKNDGIKYDNLPNYMGENDILFSYLKNTPINYFIDDSERGLFTIISLFEGTSNLHTFSRFADSYRTVSIRIIFPKNPNSALKDLEGSGFATGVLPSALETADIDFENDNVYASGFLLDSLITYDMITAYREKYGLSDSEAYESLKDHALGLNDPELNWMALSGTRVQVLLHGREWNANIHALNVSGELSIGNNFKDRTLEIIVDKERESALISVPNGSLSISVDNVLNIDAKSVEGSGLEDIQKKIFSTQELSLPLSRNISLMMLPIRPRFVGKNLNGSSALELTDINLPENRIQASSYILEKIDMLYVDGHTAITPDLLNVARSRHSNVLNFQTATDTTYIHRMDVAGAKTNIFGETTFCKPRHQMDNTDAFFHSDGTLRNVSKKYFMVDLHDYVSAENDPTLSYLKTYLSLDVATTEQISDNKLSTDIDTAFRNDLVNSYQAGDEIGTLITSPHAGSVSNIVYAQNGDIAIQIDDGTPSIKQINVTRNARVFVKVGDSIYDGQPVASNVTNNGDVIITNSSPFGYDTILGKGLGGIELRPSGVVRALTTEDGVNSLVFNTKDPLNIVKLEARSLYKQLSGTSLRNNIEIDTINRVQDYDLANSSSNYKEEMGVLKLIPPTGGVAQTVISRYNSRAYIIPLVLDNRIIYVIQFAGPDIVFSVRLNTYVQNGFVYPVSDLNVNISTDIVTENDNPVRILTDYERQGINNFIDAEYVDELGFKPFFTRPLITWINFSVVVAVGGKANFGDVISITFQPAQYMPLWLDRDTSYWVSDQEKPGHGPAYKGFMDHVEKTNYSAGFIYGSLYKLLRGCTEIVIESADKDLQPIDVSIGNASVSSKSYSAAFKVGSEFSINNDLGVYSISQDIYDNDSQPDFLQKFRDFVKTTLSLKHINIEREFLRIKDITGAQVFIRSFPKRIVRTQGKKESTKIKYVSEQKFTLSRFSATNRAYYNLISRLDFLDVRQQDGIYENISALKWFQSNVLFNGWLLDSAQGDGIKEYTLDNFNLGQYIKAFLAAAVDCNRVSRMRNGGLSSMTNEMVFRTDGDYPEDLQQLKKFFSDDLIVSSLRDAEDPRQAGVFTKISIPHIIRFNRK